MAVQPLKETEEVFDLTKHLSKIELLRDPAVLPDYGLNAAFEIFYQAFLNYGDKVMGMVLANPLTITANGADKVTVGSLLAFFRHLCLTLPITEVTLGVGADFSGVFYLKITEKRFISSDAPDADYGGISPSVDLRFVAGSDPVDTHNEYRYKLEYGAADSLPANTNDLVGKVRETYIKLADITTDSSSVVNSVTLTITELVTKLNELVSKGYQDRIAFKDTYNIFTKSQVVVKSSDVLTITN